MPNETAARAKTPRKRRRFGLLGLFRLIGRILAILIMVGIITGCIVACVLTVFVLNTLDSSDRIVLDSAAMSYTTILYAEDPETGGYTELQRVQNSENRIWADYDQIPQAMKDAAVAVEDKRFWEHSGIDLRRTIGATLNYLNPMATDYYGGSTITQQVVKNVTDDNDFRVDRKMREIFRAINLEKNYSKEQILETYLNTIALGNGTNGVQSAANVYFGKDVSELTPAECASIIAITQNPSKWNPFQHPENNRTRQLYVLSEMHDQLRPDGTPMLSDMQYDKAVAQEMVFETETFVETISGIQNWFIDAVYDEVLKDLVDKAGYTESGAMQALRTAGLRIYTTVDPAMQEYLETAYLVEGTETFPAIINEEYPESAFVILNLEGEIKALVGSNREKTGARMFNRATSAKRQPGSSIKPLSVYSLAIEYGLINYSTVIEDSPILLRPDDPTSEWPKNANREYLGRMTVVEAIQRSTNTIAVKVEQMLTPRASYDFLTNSLGFTSLEPSDADLAPMSIGALTYGVTPLEMAAGYQIFGNGGLYYKPHSYTKVLDAEGNTILENKIVPRRVISLETATVMNQLLQRVTDSAPGTGSRSRFGSMPVAGKTGTSQDDENQWFIGVTPYYVGACWLGYDQLETIRYTYYPPPIIWHTIMEHVHEGLEAKPFSFGTNAKVVQMSYCRLSGHLFNEETCSIIDPDTGRETNRGVGWYRSDALPPVCFTHDFRTPEEIEAEELAQKMLEEYMLQPPGGESESDPSTVWKWQWGDPTPDDDDDDD